jgi:hypothetical protein
MVPEIAGLDNLEIQELNKHNETAIHATKRFFNMF